MWAECISSEPTTVPGHEVLFAVLALFLSLLLASSLCACSEVFRLLRSLRGSAVTHHNCNTHAVALESTWTLPQTYEQCFLDALW